MSVHCQGAVNVCLLSVLSVGEVQIFSSKHSLLNGGSRMNLTMK